MLGVEGGSRDMSSLEYRPAGVLEKIGDKLIAVAVLTRAHTMPLETVPAIVAAYVAGGTPQEIAIWGVFGVLYHLGGYGMNSVMDWVNGYDKEDDNKQHHPLNTGEIDVRVAGLITLFFISASVGIALSMVMGLVISSGSWAAGVILVIGFISAVAYNQWGKETSLKFGLICTAHSTVFAIPYVTTAGIDHVAVLGTLMVWLWVLYQISVSGEIKDITTDESNLMKELGMEPELRNGVWYISINRMKDTFRTYATFVRILITIVFIIGSLVMTERISPIYDMATVLFIAFIGLLTVIYSDSLVDPGLYRRQKRIKQMSTVEMLTLVMFVAVFNQSLGIVVSIALITGATGWAYAVTYIMWGSRLAPKV